MADQFTLPEGWSIAPAQSESNEFTLPEGWSVKEDTPLERLANTAKGVVGAFGAGAEDINIGITSGIGRMIPGLDPVEKYARAQEEARAQRESRGIGYNPQNTFGGAAEKLKAGDIAGAAGETIGATLEAGSGSLPGMAVMALPIVGTPAFWGAQTENMAIARAQNSGRKVPNATDYVYAGTSAAVQAYLEKIGIKGLENNPFVAKVGDGIVKRIGIQGANALLKGLNEGATEAGQQIAQYVTEVVGTDKPFDLGEMARQAATAAAGGVGVGASIGMVNQNLQRRNTQADKQTPAKSSALKSAIIEQESGGREKVVNPKSGATGQFQITKPFLDDANRFMGTSYTLEDMKKPALAQQVYDAWHDHYTKQFVKDNGRMPTDKEVAMMHHGGPYGYRKPNVPDQEGKTNIDYANEVMARKSGQDDATASIEPTQKAIAPQVDDVPQSESPTPQELVQRMMEMDAIQKSADQQDVIDQVQQAQEKMRTEQVRQPRAGVDAETMEPWQMTAFDYAAQHSRRMTELQRIKPRSLAKLYGSNGPTEQQAKEHAARMRDWNREYRQASKAHNNYLANQGVHRDIVAQAISEGKPVPTEVLADYPEFQVPPSDRAASMEITPEVAVSDMEQAVPPGAAKDTQVSADWKERKIAERLMDSPAVDAGIKERLGQSGAVYYQPVSHVRTEQDVMKFVDGKDPMEMADLALDMSAPIDPTVRNRMSIITIQTLDKAANELDGVGDSVTAESVRAKAAELSAELAKTATEQGRAIEVLKTLGQDSPEGVVKSYRNVVERSRVPYKKVVDAITETMNESDAQTAERVSESEPVKKAVGKAVKRKPSNKTLLKVKAALKSDGKVDLANVPKPSERTLWDMYVAGFGKAMDSHITNLNPRQQGELENFARDVKRLFISKLPKAKRSESIRSAVSAVRSQIANINEMRLAWAKARDIAIKKSSDPERTAALIKQDMGAPFSVADLRKVMRELGYFNVKNIARTWGADRTALTQTIVDVLMQDQTTLNARQSIVIADALRKSIDSIIDGEKLRMTEHQEKLAKAKAEREASKREGRPAAKGVPIGDMYKSSAARTLAGRLARIYGSREESSPAIKELMRDVVSALSENIPTQGQGETKQSRDYRLITDAVMNRDQYIDVWERARAMAKDKYPGRAAEIDRVFDNLDSVVPLKPLRNLMKEDLEATGVDLKEIIKEHYSTIDKTGQTLGDRIAYRLNLSPEDARHVASVVQAEFVRQASVARAKALAALVKRRPFAGRVVKNSMDKLVDLAAIGALDTEHVYNAIAEKNKLPKYDAETVGKIRTIALELRELGKVMGEFGHTVEYFRKMREMEDFLLSLYPTNILNLLTGSGARLNMLASLKSGITNIVGNTVLSVSEGLSRRLAAKSMNGVNGDFARQYFDYVRKVYRESGYDPSRMAIFETDEDGNEVVTLQMDNRLKTLGEENAYNAQGPGRTRQIIRWGQNIIFNKALGAPDVAFAAAHFADAANILSTTYARQQGLDGDGLRREALKVFKDAARIEPETMIGRMVRAQAIKDAMRATLTDDTPASTVALKIRKLLDHIPFVKNLNLGELNIPFAKTPANIVMRGFEASGVFAIPDAAKIAKGIRSGDPDLVDTGVRGLTTAGLGMLAGFLLASLFDPEDYIGEYWMYDQKERALIKAKGGSYNSIKIGDRYVSLDYFGAFASPLVGMLMAEKMSAKGEPWWTMPFYYYRSVLLQAGHIPGLKQAADATRWMFDKAEYSQGVDDAIKDAYSGLIDFVAARVVPAIMGDIAKALDPYERQIDYESTMAPIDRVMQNVPGAREGLPVRVDMFGDKIESQDGFSVLLAGARLRKGRESELVNELQRLNEAGELPPIADIRTASTRIKRLRDRIGSKELDGIVNTFYSTFKVQATQMMRNPSYQPASDTEKKDMWRRTKDRSLDMVLSKYGRIK